MVIQVHTLHLELLQEFVNEKYDLILAFAPFEQLGFLDLFAKESFDPFGNQPQSRGQGIGEIQIRALDAVERYIYFHIF